VRQILIIEKRQPVRDVAVALGMEYANFHARVTGRTRFKASEMSALISEIPDPRLCDVLLRNTPFVAVARPTSRERLNESALHAATRLTTESVAAVEQISSAMVKGQFETCEYEQLVARVAEAERAVCALRLSLFSLAPRRRQDTAPHTASQAREGVSPGRESANPGREGANQGRAESLRVQIAPA